MNKNYCLKLKDGFGDYHLIPYTINEVLKKSMEKAFDCILFHNLGSNYANKHVF